MASTSSAPGATDKEAKYKQTFIQSKAVVRAFELAFEKREGRKPSVEDYKVRSPFSIFFI